MTERTDNTPRLDPYAALMEDAAVHFQAGDTVQTEGAYFGGALLWFEGAYYWVGEDYDDYEQLPPFVQCEDDALAYFRVVERWYQRGLNDGAAHAKRQLRDWLCE